jgi:hypothetical protein
MEYFRGQPDVWDPSRENQGALEDLRGRDPALEDLEVQEARGRRPRAVLGRIYASSRRGRGEAEAEKAIAG